MAITINDVPQDYSASGNPIVWTFESDQTGQANFSFLVEVYVGGTLRGRQQIFPGNGINARIDVSGYAERYTEVPALSNSLVADAANYNEIYLEIIERYGDPIADGATLTSSTINVFKAKQSDVDFINWTPTNYKMTAPAPLGGVQWLTTFPASSTEYYQVGETEQARIMIISDENVDSLNIQLYDADLVLLGGVTVAVASHKIVIFNVSQSAIIAGSTITQGDLDSATYISLEAVDTAVLNSNLFYFQIDRTCKKDTAKRVHFLSTLGTMESFTYSLFSNEKGSIKTASYEREFGNWNAESFEFSLSRGRSVDYLKTLNKELLLRSDWLSQALQNWLEIELGNSPLVYIEDSNDLGLGLRRVAVKKSAFTLKTTRQDTKFREDLLLTLERFSSTAI